jgi:ElaA protein
VRLAVFVAEQRVPIELEIDEHDATARHWVARDEGEDGRVVGTARVVEKPDGAWKIGRVAVAASHRGKGVGAAIMRAILADARAEGAPGALLESQTHAMGFYERLGFAAEGPEFLDAGIPHRLMRLAF